MREEQVARRAPFSAAGLRGRSRGFPQRAEGAPGRGRGTRQTERRRRRPGRAREFRARAAPRTPTRPAAPPRSPARPEEGRWRRPRWRERGRAGAGPAGTERTAPRPRGGSRRPPIGRAGRPSPPGRGRRRGHCVRDSGAGRRLRGTQSDRAAQGSELRVSARRPLPGQEREVHCETPSRAQPLRPATTMTHFNKGPSYGLSAEVKNKVRRAGVGSLGPGGSLARRLLGAETSGGGGGRWPPSGPRRPPGFVPAPRA